ncbi:MAG: hypothetical protein ACYTF1_09795 [Planctomycetota bacterium]|jgi:hypothetical protein
MKRILITFLILIVGAACGLLGLWYYIGREGSTDIEQWIGRQVVAIIEGHVTPTVNFDTLDYQAPQTVVIENLALAAENQQILSVDRVLLELAEIPKEGKPIQIQRIDLHKPRLKFSVVPPGDLVGWSGFVRQDLDAVPQGQRLSDVLVLREVTIRDGLVVYDDADPSSEAMTLPGINLILNTAQLSDEPGWYKLAGTFKRDPIVNVDINGRINLDTGLLDIKDLKLNASLSEEQYATLPPPIQKLLRRHQVLGRLTAEFQGKIPLTDPQQTQGQVKINLENGNFAYKNTSWPIGRLQMNATLPKGPIYLTGDNLSFNCQNRQLMSLKQIALHLPQIPETDTPLQVEQIKCDSPSVYLIRAQGGGFIGWNSLVEPQEDKPTAPVSTEKVNTFMKWVLLQKLEINNGRLVYDLADGSEPMTLPGINLALKTAPLPQDPGWFKLTATFKRESLLNANIDGRINLNTGLIDLKHLKLNASLGQEQYATLPPQVQKFLRSHQVLGKLSADFQGKIPLTDPQKTEGQVQIDLENGNFAYKNIAWTIGELQANTTLPKGPVHLTGNNLSFHNFKQQLLSMKRITMQLPHLPKTNTPLQIEQLKCDSPSVHLIEAQGGGFVGWNNLMGPNEDESPEKTNDVMKRLLLQKMEINNGRLVYDLADGSNPMTLPGINLVLLSAPQTDGYAIIGNITHDPQFNVKIDGGINLKRSILEFKQLQINAQLGERQYQTLPPNIQNFLRKYKTQGRLNVDLQGQIPFKEPALSSGQLKVNLTNARFAFEDMLLPVEQFTLRLKIADKTVSSQCKANLLEGTFLASANIKLDKQMPLDLKWKLGSMKLEKAISVAQQGPSKYAGVITSQGQMNAQIANMPASLKGNGKLRIDKGRLMSLPIIRDLMILVTKVRLGNNLNPDDRAQCDFKLLADHIHLAELEITSPMVVINGSGRIFYDQRLDLDFKVRLLDKLKNQLNRLGEIGQIIGALSDTIKVVTYNVRGTLAEPKVTVKPMGLGRPKKKPTRKKPSRGD